MESAPRDLPAARRRGGARRLALGAAAALLLGGATWWLASAYGDPPPLVEPHGRPTAEVASEVVPPSLVDAPADPARDELGAAIAATREPLAPRAGGSTPGTLLLHVVDRDTGVALAACETRIRLRDDPPLADSSHLDASDFAPLMRGDSPLQLVAPTTPPSIDTLRVEAPGHAAATLVVDWSAGGERTIELAAAAELTVVVTGAPDTAAPIVRVHDAARLDARYEEDRRYQQRRSARATMRFPVVNETLRDENYRLGWPIGPQLEPIVLRLLEGSAAHRVAQLDGDGRVSFPRLAAGRWLVDVVTDTGRRSTTHAVGEITLRAGHATTLELEWGEPVARPLVSVAGRLLFHRGWFEHGMPELPRMLQVRSLERDIPDRIESIAGRFVTLEWPDRGDAPRFDAGELRPGRALATLSEWHWSTIFEIPPAGSETIEIVVPPPSRVVVHAHALGEPERRVPFLLRWRSSSPPLALVEDSLNDEGRSSDDEHAIQLVVPQGDLELWAKTSPEPRFMVESHHHVAKEREELVIEVRDAARVDLTFREGRDAIVVPERESLRSLWFATSDGPLGPYCWSASGGGSISILLVDGDGPALLHLDPCDDYAMVAPVPVELKRGETVAVDLPVRRARR